MTSFVDGNGVSICYEEFGESDDVLLLLAGRGGQLTDWHTDLIAQFVARDFRVIRFDNRDAGLSTHMRDEDLPYSLSDMAGDVTALMQALGIARAFLMGQSLGAMIAQQIAIDAPKLVQGLVLISGNTGAEGVGMPADDVMQTLMADGRSKSDDASPLERGVKSSTRWTSWDLGVTEEELTQRIQARVDRNSDRSGAVRHLKAVINSPDRTAALRDLDVPTVVIHGSDDPLVDVSGGRATAEAIPGADLVIIDKMRHDLPRAIWPQLLEAVESVKLRAYRRSWSAHIELGSEP